MNTDALRDWTNRQIFSAGLRIAPHLPTSLVRPSARLAARAAARHDGHHVQTLRRNLTALLGDEPSPALIRASIASQLRNHVEVMALGSWSGRRITDQVTVIGEDRLRAAHAEQGAVLALTHSANWDLAGAWACLSGLPVTTVAERLGEREFSTYTRIRSHLGMQVLAHDDPRALRRLVAAVGEGRVICLLSERMFGPGGLEVSLAGHPIRVPAGPAMVARTSGAALFAAVAYFTDTGMVIELSPQIEHRPGREGLTAMMQQVADHFTDRLRAHPEDWHMMQPLLGEHP